MNAIIQHPAVRERTNAPVLTPTDFPQLVKFAEMASRSGLVPAAYNNKPEMIMIAVQMGSELGLSPMQALQSIAVINGRPGVFGDGLIGLCRSSSLCEDIAERFEGEGDQRKAVCVAKRRGQSPCIGEFSVADAKRANLWGKTGPWTNYPDRMLRNRARGFALRDAFPDVLRGLRMAEELYDTPPERDDFRGETIEAEAPSEPARTITTAAPPPPSTQQPPPSTQPRMKVSEFLDSLDAELKLAPDSAAVEALLNGPRVIEARGLLQNTAAKRLADWTDRALERLQALRDDEAEAEIEFPGATGETVEPNSAGAILERLREGNAGGPPASDEPADDGWPGAGP